MGAPTKSRRSITSPLTIYNSDGYRAQLVHDSSEQLSVLLTTAAPGAPTVALAGAGAGNVDNGDHYYLVTLVTAAGETEAGTVSAAVTILDKTVDGKVALSNIPTGNAFVTSRKIYRTAAGGSTYGLLTTIADNSTTTYTDNTADSGLGAVAPTANNALDSRLMIYPSGAVAIAAYGTAAAPALTLGAASVGLASVSNQLVISTAGTQRLAVGSSSAAFGVPASMGGWFIVKGAAATDGIGFGKDHRIMWASTATDDGTVAGDVGLTRDGAAGVLAQMSGAQAQELRIYGTTTGSKYASLKHDGTNALLTTSSGILKIGAGSQLDIECTDGNLNFLNQTTGAGAALGTLTNAPSSGNPSFWLPIRIAGNVRYLPCWS